MATEDPIENAPAPETEPGTPNTIQVPAKDIIETPETPEVAEVAEAPAQPKDDELDIQDGRRLDQNVKANEFDKEKEEELAHADPPEISEAEKHAIKNPNGAGSEWPRV